MGKGQAGFQELGQSDSSSDFAHPIVDVICRVHVHSIPIFAHGILTFLLALQKWQLGFLVLFVSYCPYFTPSFFHNMGIDIVIFCFLELFFFFGGDL